MADWYLPAGAPGSPDEWCFRTVLTSQIKIYTSTPDYHARLADLIAQAETDDEILFVGWQFNLEVILKAKKSALLYLEAARGRGARVRLLATPTLQFKEN